MLLLLSLLKYYKLIFLYLLSTPLRFNFGYFLQIFC